MSLSCSSRLSSRLASSSLRTSSTLSTTNSSRLSIKQRSISQRSTRSRLDIQSAMTPVPSHSRLFSSAPILQRSKPQVLLLDQINFAKAELKQLETIAEVISSTSTSRDEFLKDLKGKYSGISALYRHFGGARSIKVTGRFNSELVESLPKSLKFIAHNGAGYDQLDIEALTKRSIAASNVPTAVDDATSDTALFLLLGAIRRFPLALASLETTFNSSFPFTTAFDPRGKTLGLIGMGGIGGAFAKKASAALGMKIIYHNRNQLSAEKERENGNATYKKTMEEILKESDVVSLHCPLNEKTKGLIGKKELEMMKKTSILINTSRGPVVREAELAEALENDVIAGCGLDVYESEPKVHPSLAALSSTKALLLPHVGTLTLETQTEMEAVCINNLIHGLEKGQLGFVVNEQKGIL